MAQANSICANLVSIVFLGFRALCSCANKLDAAADSSDWQVRGIFTCKASLLGVHRVPLLWSWDRLRTLIPKLQPPTSKCSCMNSARVDWAGQKIHYMGKACKGSSSGNKKCMIKICFSDYHCNPP